jgi:hypothetical protein
MTGSQLSWQVRLAAALVGLGTALGVGMIVLAFALVRGDPGFLFAVLPIVFVFLTVAGLNIAAFSWALVVRLRLATPGVRMQIALFGGCLVVSGFFVAAGSAPAAVFLVLYGGTLVWLMTTPAAAHDLGAWIAPVPRRAWFARGTPLRQQPWSPPPGPQGSHGSSRAGPQQPWSQGPPLPAGPRPWWETWQAGLAQGMPLWELLLVGAALLAFAVGLLSIPLGLALFPAIGPLSVLIPLAVAVVWFVEQRMKARLARG